MNSRFTRDAANLRVRLAREPDFLLAGVEIRPVRRQIVSAAAVEVLEPRVMQVLVALARSQGVPVSRDELIESCWEGVIVGDDAINRSIGRLRKAAEATGSAFSIETLPRVGYRLMVGETDAAAPESTWESVEERAPLERDIPAPPLSPHRFPLAWLAGAALFILALVAAGAGLWWLRPNPASAPGPPASVAVLPFVNMSGDPANDYFSDGFSEELINDLSSNPRLLVAARTSCFAFRGRNDDMAAIARALHVHAVVEGSVREAGNRVRIDVQLVDASLGYDIWSARYDRKMADILNVQDEVARAVALALTPKLLSGTIPRAISIRAPINPDAYQKYLKGRYLLDKRTDDGDVDAIRLFKEVVAVESSFAPAYAGLGRAYVHFAEVHGQRCETLAAAESALDAALRLDPRNIEARSEHLLLSLMKWDWNRSADDAGILESLNSHNIFTLRSLAIYYGSFGFLEQQSAALREATRLDPLSFVDLNNLANAYYNRGEYVESASAAADALALRPNRPLTLFHLCLAFVELKRIGDAKNLLARLRALHEPEASDGCELMLMAASGKTGDAHALADGIARNFPAFIFTEADIGFFYLAASDAPEALKWFKRAYDRHDYYLFAFARFSKMPPEFLATPGWKTLMNQPEAKAWQAAHDRLADALSGSQAVWIK